MGAENHTAAPTRWAAGVKALRAVAAAAALASLAAFAAPPVPRNGLAREPLRLPVVLDSGERLELEALLIEPKEAGPFPLALITHGSPREGAARRRMSAAHLSFQAEELARRGYVAVVVMRRGFGTSQGE